MAKRNSAKLSGPSRKREKLANDTLVLNLENESDDISVHSNNTGTIDFPPKGKQSSFVCTKNVNNTNQTNATVREADCPAMVSASGQSLPATQAVIELTPQHILVTDPQSIADSSITLVESAVVKSAFEECERNRGCQDDIKRTMRSKGTRLSRRVPMCLQSMRRD